MRRMSVNHNTFDVLSFILQGKGGENDEAKVKEVIFNIKKKMIEVEDAAAEDTSDSSYVILQYNIYYLS